MDVHIVLGDLIQRFFANMTLTKKILMQVNAPFLFLGYLNCAFFREKKSKPYYN